MNKTILFPALLIVSLSFLPKLRAADLETLQKAEKVALVLTGMPLSDELRTKLLADQVTLDQIADSLTKSPGFIDKFAQYWTVSMGVQTALDVFDLKAPNGQNIWTILRNRTITRIDGANRAQTYNEKFQY